MSRYAGIIRNGPEHHEGRPAAEPVSRKSEQRRGDHGKECQDAGEEPADVHGVVPCASMKNFTAKVWNGKTAE